MAARGLRRDAGRTGQFARGERTAIHQHIEHVGPARIADQRTDLRQPGLIERGRHPNSDAIL